MTEELVTVGTYSTAFEANLVKAKLAASDVEAFLADDNMVSVNPLLTNLLGGVKVRVPESQAADARRILGIPE